MSLSGALSNALSGLTVTSRSAQVVSSNISNAMTEGYGVREAQISSRFAGDEGGVQFLGIQRNTNQVVISDRRSAEAGYEAASIRNNSLSRVQSEFGLPGELGSLHTRLTDFEVSLVDAQTSPDSEQALSKVSETATRLADKINSIGSTIQNERSLMDRKIENSISDLNSNLEKIAEINSEVKKKRTLNHDTSALLDHRQALVDRVNALVPVRQLEQGDGSIGLVTESGVFLVDSSAATISFDGVNTVTEHSNITNGALSSPRVGDVELFEPFSQTNKNSGALGAMLWMRDVELVEAQSTVDAMARELIERLSDPAVVGTTGPSDPGFFTDAGAIFDPVNEVGIAQRIELNPLIDESGSGETWRIRDGLAAGAPFDVGASKFIQEIQGALDEVRAVSSSTVNSVTGSLSSVFASLTSEIASTVSQSDQQLAYDSARLASAEELENNLGVDSDQQMQKLLLIEQAYAANARVIQAVDEMLDWLMRI